MRKTTMFHTFSIFCFVVCMVHAVTAFQWTSTGNLPNGTRVHGCPGQEVTLPWSFSVDAAEHLLNVEWHFKPSGGRDVLVATQTQGSFVMAPGVSSLVRFIPNAGLSLTNAAVADSGTYSVYVDVDLHGSTVREVQTVELTISDMPVTTDGELHVKLLPDAMFVNSTQQYHALLSCGDFLTFWGTSGVSVVWTTPSKQNVTSSYYDKGQFLLLLPNPVISGEYSCGIEDSSPASMCLTSSSPIRRGATLAVDSVQTQLSVMGSQIKALQMKTDDMERKHMQEKNSLEQQLEAMRHDNTVLKNTLTAQIQTASRSIAFHAWRNHWDRTLNSGDIMVFEQAVFNEGGAYDKTTGIFTAPVGGTYAFFVTIVTDETSPTLVNTDAGLYLDNYLLASTYSSYNNDHHESGTCQAVTYVRPGQRVLVRNLNSQARYYPTYSTFSGALLHAH